MVRPDPGVLRVPVRSCGRQPAESRLFSAVLARTLPYAGKVVLPCQGDGASQTAPGAVARVIETLAGKVR